MVQSLADDDEPAQGAGPDACANNTLQPAVPKLQHTGVLLSSPVESWCVTVCMNATMQCIHALLLQKALSPAVQAGLALSRVQGLRRLQLHLSRALTTEDRRLAAIVKGRVRPPALQYNAVPYGYRQRTVCGSIAHA